MDVREKLVELLEKAKAKEQYDFLFGDIDAAIDMPHGAEYYADFLIAHGVTVQEWISVEDRLPEKGGSYLVFSSKSKTVFTAHYWLGDRWSNRANGQFITHWMPLPQPPKGE